MKYLCSLVVVSSMFIANYTLALTPTQIKQIEEIAQTIAYQSNQQSDKHLDEMTTVFNASANGRNVMFEYTIRVKKGLSDSVKKAYSDEVQKEITPGVCRQNINNPAFKRGLSYIFVYKNTYGELLSQFTVDEAVCSNY